MAEEIKEVQQDNSRTLFGWQFKRKAIDDPTKGKAVSFAVDLSLIHI